MNIVSTILKEMLHRKTNALLSMLAVVMAVAFYVSFLTTGEASKRETARIMRNIGYNIRIVHKDTDMNQFWDDGYSALTMPEEYAAKFSSLKGFSYAHILATLQKRIEWRGESLILTGISTEIAPPDHKKPPMIFTIKPGTVYVGYQIADKLGIKRGDTIDLMGKEFSVYRTLSETGTDDDVRIYAHLTDVQNILGQQGLVNEIKAIDCLCTIPDIDPVAELRAQLGNILPDAKMFHIRTIAEARENQRQLMDNYFALLIPLVTIVCAVWIGTLAMMNTKERQNEIGILRALGYGSGTIGGLFLGKAVLIGAIGAVLGFALGTAVALVAGPDIFQITAKNIQPIYSLLWWSMVIAPVFAAISSFIPAMTAVMQDPAETLRDM